MSIQLNYRENFSNGIKRLITEECETAISEIREAESEHEKHIAVHESRKAFKKIRACLRLVRDQIDYYDKENTFFRDSGREISEIRDATAHIETLELLKDQYSSHLYKNSFDDLREELLNYRKELAEKIFREEQRLEIIRESLETKIQEILDWDLEVDGFDDIRPGLKRTYKRGYKGLEKAKESREIDDFHEWRKRAKYLRYQIDILNRMWPQPMEVMEGELHDLTDFTGTLHDLHNLKVIISKQNTPYSDFESKTLLHVLIDKHQNFLKTHALLKGGKFYVDSPSDFCDRLNVYWENHQHIVNEDDLPRPEQIEY